MNFTQSIETGFRKYVDFTGRASRSAFWWWVLFVVVAHALAHLLGRSFAGLVSLILLLPSIAVTTRRLHDTGKSGWWQLVELVPILGWVVLIVLCIQEPVEPNPYG